MVPFSFAQCLRHYNSAEFEGTENSFDLVECRGIEITKFCSGFILVSVVFQALKFGRV